MDKRNLCDKCAECEDNNKSLTFCFDVCGHPVDILEEVEKKRNLQNKINNANDTNWPADGLTEDEVNRAIREGLKRTKSKMTVKELKEQLNRYDDNLVVVVNQDSVYRDGVYKVSHLTEQEGLLYLDIRGEMV